MQRISLFYMYRLSNDLKNLNNIHEGQTLQHVQYFLLQAQWALKNLLADNLLSSSLRICRRRAYDLLTNVSTLVDDTDKSRLLSMIEVVSLQHSLREFEAVFGAEMEAADAYLVLPKAGFETIRLVADAEVIFPPDLPSKVPDAVRDVREAGKCIAFELPTAAGFHLHRANESVLHKYYDKVTGGRARPKTRTMGAYLKILDDDNRGEAKVRSALRDLKDLHRNPLIHPDQSLESVDEAIALLCGVRVAMTHMLKEIDLPAPISVADAVVGGLLGVSTANSTS